MNEHKHRVFYSLTKDIKTIKKKFYHSILYIHLSQTYLKKEISKHNFSIVQDFLLEEGDNNHDRKKVENGLKTYFLKQFGFRIYCKKYLHMKKTRHFLYNIDGKTSFLGCTPEMLCMFKNRLNTHIPFIPEALAGTVVRGSNIKEDLG